MADRTVVRSVPTANEGAEKYGRGRDDPNLYGSAAAERGWWGFWALIGTARTWEAILSYLYKPDAVNIRSSCPRDVVKLNP